MGGAALQQIQLDAADLGAGLLLQHLGQDGGQTAQLGVAEAVVGGHLGLGHEVTVFVVDTLGHGNDAVAGGVVDLLHVLDELGHAEVGLGQIDQVGAGAVLAG